MQPRVLTGQTAAAAADQPRPPRVFDSESAPADPAVLEQLETGVAGADLAAPPVVLPDFHHKHDMEMPSSIAVATEGTIRSTLTSASVNCGMALIALDADRPGRAAVEDFYRGVRERYPYPTTRRRDLTPAEVLRAATDGAGFAVDRWGIDPASLARIEEQGRVALEPYGGDARVARELPWLSVQLSRQRFGTIGPSNHFVELQQVEEVLDPAAAELLGVRGGQLTLQYHGGGGVLAGQVGRMFGRREKISGKVKVQMRVQKPLFHLATARSLAELRLRLALYFSDGCPPVERASAEGERLLLATAAAMNYGFAFRMATYASLCALAQRSLGARGHQLVVDSPHNSIYEEEVGGRPAVVHRHNSCRAFPAARMAANPVFGRTGQAVLLPGTNRTSSYLCVAGDRAEQSLYSACHGAGTVVADFAARGISRPDPEGRSTLKFNYRGTAPVEAAHLDDKGVDEALGILVHHGLVRPVARMRPFAVLN